jgi:putative transposase
VLCSAARHGLRLGEKGAQPGGVEFLKAALFLGIDCGGQWTGKGRCRDRGLPPLKWSSAMFRKTEETHGQQATKPEEIVTKLRQVEVLTGQGMPRLDAIRQIGVTEQTFYRWKKKYGGMGTDQLKELKRLQKENERLRKAVSDLTLDKLILAEAAKGNF